MYVGYQDDPSADGGEDHRQDTHGPAKCPLSRELMCAMRVHVMTENETHIFCPADAKVRVAPCGCTSTEHMPHPQPTPPRCILQIWEDNCQEVEFANYTAISAENELLVINVGRSAHKT